MQKENLTFLFTFFVGLFSTILYAQEEACGTDHIHETRVQNDLKYAKSMEEQEAKIKSFYKYRLNQAKSVTTPYTIPVVVHIIHLGEAEGVDNNISDAQVRSAIDRLNHHYANHDGNTAINDNGVDVGIQFALASRDENGNTTTGINRVDGSGVTNYTDYGIEVNNSIGAEMTEIKELSKWNTDQFMNIWIVHEIGNGNGTAGYANYPVNYYYAYDGIVVKRKSFGYDPDGSLFGLPNYSRLNGTLAHEVGHYLNLRHTFNGDNEGASCPADDDCSSDGDLVCDTDVHIRPTVGGYCFEQGYTSGGVEYDINTCITRGTLGEVAENLMNYTSEKDIWDNHCRNRFTQGQADRMIAALLTSRSELLEDQVLAVATDAMGCEIEKITATVETMMSIETTSILASINIFPNPSGGAFKVSLELGATEEISINLVNILGKKTILGIYEGRIINANFDLMDIPAGTYFIEIGIGAERVVEKLIIR